MNFHTLGIGIAILVMSGIPQCAAQAHAQDPVDLLAQIDPVRDSVRSEWTKDASGLVCTPALFTLLQIPFLPPKEYDLTLTAERLGDPEALAIGLVAEGARFAVVLDGWRGATSGVHRIAGQNGDNNVTTFREALFQRGKPATIVCRVRSGHLTVIVGERTVIDWAADYRLASDDEGWTAPQEQALYVGTYATSYRISKLTLTPVTGPGTVLKETSLRTAQVGGAGGEPFQDLAPAGGLLVGLRSSLAAYGASTIIKSVEPVYRIGASLQNGRMHGRPSERVVETVARPDYAVGGIVAKSWARVDGFRLIFMKVTPDGLDPKDSYEGEWIGGQGGGPEVRMAGDGKRFLGIYGREGEDLDALGLAYRGREIPEALIRPGEVTPEETEKLDLLGSRLSGDRAMEYQAYLEAKPGTLRLRLVLMGYYGRRGGQAVRSRGSYADLVVGLVEHHPSLDLAFDVSRFLEPPAFEKGAAFWLAAAKANPTAPRVLGNAGAYLTSNLFVEDFRPQGRALLEQARKLDPREPRWPLHLGEGYSAEFLANRSKETAGKALASFEDAYALAAAPDRPRLRPEGRHILHVLANAAFEAGEMEKARKHAAELLSVISEKEEGWNFGNAIHDANLIQGRVALKAGKLEEAKRFLLAAGRTPGSPQLNSFGPSMDLAGELLNKGERGVVLQYFELCRTFWNNDDAIELLDNWSKIVKEGKTPDFSHHERR